VCPPNLIRARTGLPRKFRDFWRFVTLCGTDSGFNAGLSLLFHHLRFVQIVG
jgi:hypothetical protein